MRREVPPSKVSPFTAFPALPYPYTQVKFTGKTTFGHVSKDGLWAWIARDSMLEVFSMLTLERCSSWRFGAVLKNASFTITAVTEFCSSSIHYPCLLVGVDTQTDGALLCMFNVKTSKVVKVIELPYKITSLEVVSGEGGANIETNPLSPVLRCMFGVVAVGTECGHVLFMDLCLDEENYSDEIAPNKVVFVTKATSNIPGKREMCLPRGQHLCLCLNDDSVTPDDFEYKGFSCVLATFPADDIYVSALKYMRSLAVLAVGFSFGGIQIWNLQKLSIQQTLPIHPNKLPVVQFAFQEPENDPLYYCYLWGITGFHQGENFRPGSVSVASLYSLIYTKKKWETGFGYVYQGFRECSKRFEYVLSNDPFNHRDSSKSICSRLITCHIVPPADSSYRLDADDNLQTEELNVSEDLSTCVMAWEVWPTAGDSPSSCHLVFFDINQWYQAQMPSELRYDAGELCSFLGVFSLEAITRKMYSESLLDIYVVPHTLTKFKCLTVAEEFFYPSSLSFKTWCITVGGSVHANYLGTHRQLLSEMNQAGPNCLIHPKELYNCFLASGLLSHMQETLPGKHVTVVLQREALLTLALEQNMCYFLHQCIQRWSSGEFVNVGCSAKFLLEWAWKRVIQIKASIDKLCQPLFNCSGHKIDKSTIQSLVSYENQLKRLVIVMTSFQTLSGPKTEQGKRELALRIEVVESVAMYLHVLLWLYDSHLLPEHSEGEEYGEDEVAYPVSRLNRSYSCRRLDLQKLHSSIAATDILLVDGLVAEMGSDLANLWKTKGGSGIYPPPSLYAVASSYLLDGVSRVHKHLLLYYVILDMVAFLSDRQTHLLDKLTKFPQTFNISPSLTKLTQAFWLLDHQDFESAMSTLLDPVILSEDIAPWCHARILKSFLYQGHQQKALNYIALRKPPQSGAEDIKMHLSILLANSFIYEAFHYQRQHQSETNVEDLLNHLFHSCQQIHSLDALLQFPLNSTENAALIEFLRNCPEPKAQELLVMYYLLHSCPLEASNLNDKLISELMEHSSKSQERAKIRNALVTGFLNTLPEEQKMLAQEIKQMTAARANHVETKIQPLSATITSCSLPVQSYSDVLSNVISKINSISTASACAPQTPFKSSVVPHAPSTPFFGTPVAPQSSRKSRTPSNVIFATPVAKRPISRVADAQEFVSPAKKPCFIENVPFKNVDSEKRRSLGRLSADVLSLLQTPPIFKKSQFRSSASRDELSNVTLHSILKTRSPSPPGKDDLSAKSSSVSSKDGEMSVDEAEICDKIEGKKPLASNDDIQPKHLRFQDCTPPHSTTELKLLHMENLSSRKSVTDSEQSVSVLSSAVERSFRASPRRPLRELDTSASSTSSDLFLPAKESLSPPVSSLPRIRNDLNADFVRSIIEKSVTESRHIVPEEPSSCHGTVPPEPSSLQTILSDTFRAKNNLEMTPSTSDEKLFTEEVEEDGIIDEDKDISFEYEDLKENPCSGEITPPFSPTGYEHGENFTLHLSDTDQESNSEFKKPESKISPSKTYSPFSEIKHEASYLEQTVESKTIHVQAEIHTDRVAVEELHVKEPAHLGDASIQKMPCSFVTEDVSDTGKGRYFELSKLLQAKYEPLRRDITVVEEMPNIIITEDSQDEGNACDDSELLEDEKKSSFELSNSVFENSSALMGLKVEETCHTEAKLNDGAPDVQSFVSIPLPVEQDDKEQEKTFVTAEEQNEEGGSVILESSHFEKEPLDHCNEDLGEQTISAENIDKEPPREERNVDFCDESMLVYDDICDVKHCDASTPEISTPVKRDAGTARKSATASLPSPIELHAEERISPTDFDSCPYRGTRSRSKSKSGSPKTTIRRSMCEVLSAKEVLGDTFIMPKSQENKSRSSGLEEKTPTDVPKTPKTSDTTLKSRQVGTKKKSSTGSKNVSDSGQTEKTPVSSKKMQRKPRRGKNTDDKVEQPQYNFAYPNVSHDPEIFEALASSPPETPVPSFVFSPPVTRARLRQKKLSDTMNSSYMSAASEFSFTTRGRKLPEDPLLSDSSSFIPDIPEDSILSTTSEVPPSHSAKRSTTKRKKSSTPSKLPASQSIINFLSPFESELASTVRNPRRQTSGSSRHSMTLRKAKVKRKSVKLF